MREIPGEPISFQLNGVVFHCVNPIPVGAMIVMLRHVGEDSSVDQNAQMVKLLWSWIDPAQHTQFDEAMSKVSDPSLFEKLVEFIVVEAGGRPTQAS